MRLEQRDKEFAAIGASIGANCRPCIEYHLAAGREAGLSEGELATAVATARSVRDQAVGFLASRIDELLGGESMNTGPESTGPASGSRVEALVALGAGVGANAHSLLEAHVPAALRLGLTSTEIEAALAMAEHVQHRAAEITAIKASTTLQNQSGRSVAAAPLTTTAGEVKT